MGASVKIMLSYDYCHFEVALSTDEEMTNKQVNEMRKDAQRLADEAVRQYKVSKEKAELRSRKEFEEMLHTQKVIQIERKPESERTPEEKAYLKQSEDENWQKRYDYDYEDDENTLDFLE